MISVDRMAMAPTDRSMPAVKMIKGLADSQGSDHRRLLKDDGDGVRLNKSRIDDGERDARDDQHQQGADRGMGMQNMLDSLQRRLLAQGELFSRGMWCFRFDCRCHVGFLAVGDTPVSG
jgi:hypothetical protein